MCPTHLVTCHVSHSSVDVSCVTVSLLTQYQKEMLEVFEKEMVMKLVREDRKSPKLTSEKHIANILSG